MKRRYIFTAVLLACATLQPGHAETISQPPIIIAAVQTGQPGAAGNDFVVLRNMTAEPLDVTGIKLQYRSASATGAAAWTTKRAIACIDSANDCHVMLPAQTNMLISTYDIPGIARQPLSNGFSDTGGQLRLVQPTGPDTELVVLDRVGYGNAAEAEGQPAPPPMAGQSLVRKLNDQHNLTDTNNNADDFATGCYKVTYTDIPVIIPCLNEPEAPQEEPETEPTAPEPEQPVQEVTEPIHYLSLTITELLPDPASPATDSADEFIELYNPNDQPISAAGYTLQAGTDFKYQYVIGNSTVPAHGYVVVYSAESHISLTNSGTAVRINDPSGAVLDTVASYGQAKSGQAWAKASTGWQWTTPPTPGAANTVTQELPKAVLAAAAAAKKASSPAKKAAAATPKAAKAGTAAPKAAKTTASAAAPKTDEQGGNNAVQYIVLGGIGALIAGYAIYEYRQDIVRFGRKAWASVTGRKKQTPEPTQQTD